MQTIKILLVGDGDVGKTSLLITYTSLGKFPHDYVPTVFDNYSANVLIGNEPAAISLWDTAGEEEYDRLRPLSYPQTDIFLICYSVVCPSSFGNIDKKWVPEVQQFCPDTPMAVVGTKLDLRGNQKIIARLAKQNTRPITYEQGLAMANKVRARFYCECSSISRKGVQSLFAEAIRTAISPQTKSSESNGCTIM